MREITGYIIPKDDFSLTLDVGDGEVYENANLVIAYIGKSYKVHNDILEPLEFINIKQIYELYQQYGSSFTKVVGGLFTVVIFDRDKGKLFIIQDQTSSPINIYYSIENGTFFFSTSYRKLLLLSNIARKWDRNMLEVFLYNGFIPYNGTLLENVSKLVPGQFLEADIKEGEVRLRTLIKPSRQISVLSAIKNYHQALKNVIKSELELENEADTNVVLSSGYDTNLILYLIREITDKRCNTFTIGGRRGVDEIPQTEKIARLYPNVIHRTKRVDSRTLERLPDIVWRLEGAIYQQGIFLQYELARLVRDNNLSSLIAGECADQVLSKRFQPSEKLPERLCWIENAYEMGLMLILKKNGIICNSFSIEVLYPYLNQNIIEIASRLAYLNGNRRKMFHKCLIKLRLKREVATLLGKIAGTTGLGTLFESEAHFLELRKELEKTEYSGYIKDKYKEETTGSPLEQEIDLYLKVLYLLIFEKLIISGKYDRYFGTPGLDIRLGDLLK